MSVKITIPQPDVEVTDAPTGVHGTSGVDIFVSRDSKGRTYHGLGMTKNDAVKDAVKKLLDDPHTAEYVRRG